MIDKCIGVPTTREDKVILTNQTRIMIRKILSGSKIPSSVKQCKKKKAMSSKSEEILQSERQSIFEKVNSY